jgi:hypothetical protein
MVFDSCPILHWFLFLHCDFLLEGGSLGGLVAVKGIIERRLIIILFFRLKIVFFFG